MCRMVRNLYAVGNMLLRKFSFCNEYVKISLFKPYCYNVYCCSLWSNYRVVSWRKLKVCHNDILRRLFGVPRNHSASTLFVNNRIDNLDAIIRKNMYSLGNRIVNSENVLCRGLCRSEAKVFSNLWRQFGINLRGSDTDLF